MVSESPPREFGVHHKGGVMPRASFQEASTRVLNSPTVVAASRHQSLLQADDGKNYVRTADALQWVAALQRARPCSSLDAALGGGGFRHLVDF
jgi:hypothetical protein